MTARSVLDRFFGTPKGAALLDEAEREDVAARDAQRVALATKAADTRAALLAALRRTLDPRVASAEAKLIALDAQRARLLDDLRAARGERDAAKRAADSAIGACERGLAAIEPDGIADFETDAETAREALGRVKLTAVADAANADRRHGAEAHRRAARIHAHADAAMASLTELVAEARALAFAPLTDAAIETKLAELRAKLPTAADVEGQDS